MEDVKPSLTVETGGHNVAKDDIVTANNGIIKRVQLPEDQKLEKEQFLELWQDQNRYLDHLEAKLKVANQPDASRREHLLIVRLTTKEQELQELSNQIAELKASQAPSTAAMRNALLDPAVNLIVQKLKKELETTRNKLQETQEELSAWKFTPDSVTGKRLMAKCRQLLQENDEIGKMVSSGRLAKLEGELSMQKALCEEMKKNQIEMDDFVQELDDDMEGMQSTIYFLQQQLKEAKQTIANYGAPKIGDEIQISHKVGSLDASMEIDDVESERTTKNAGDSDNTYSTNQVNSKEDSIIAEQDCADNAETVSENYSVEIEQKATVAFASSDENNKESEVDTSFHEESIDDKSEELEIDSTEGASDSTTRGRGRRGTPTKQEKSDGQTKGRRSQRTTRGQKRVTTNQSADDESGEKTEEDGTATRPKRTRMAPQRFVTNDEGGKRKKTNSECEDIEEQDLK